MVIVMAELIDRNAFRDFWNKNYRHRYANDTFLVALANFPTVDAVSRGCHDQVRWERDVAIGQLEEHGIPFCGKAPDVVKVVHGRWKVARDSEISKDVWCTACGKGFYIRKKIGAVLIDKMPYCPNCGAKMKGE